jgi:hypothetical protein
MSSLQAQTRPPCCLVLAVKLHMTIATLILFRSGQKGAHDPKVMVAGNTHKKLRFRLQRDVAKYLFGDDSCTVVEVIAQDAPKLSPKMPQKSVLVSATNVLINATVLVLVWNFFPYVQPR